MATTTTQRAPALELLGARSMMRLKDFAVHGIGPETLARLVPDGIVTRPARRLYQLADGPTDARRAPQGHRLPGIGASVPRSDPTNVV